MTTLMTRTGGESGPSQCNQRHKKLQHTTSCLQARRLIAPLTGGKSMAKSSKKRDDQVMGLAVGRHVVPFGESMRVMPATNNSARTASLSSKSLRSRAALRRFIAASTSPSVRFPLRIVELVMYSSHGVKASTSGPAHTHQTRWVDKQCDWDFTRRPSCACKRWAGACVWTTRWP